MTAVPNRPSSVTFDLWFVAPPNTTLMSQRIAQAWVCAIARRNSYLAPVNTWHRPGEFIVRIAVRYPHGSSTGPEAARNWGDRIIKAATIRWPGIRCKRASIVT